MTIIYPVKDLGAATALYTELLGVDPSVNSPYYVGFDVDGQHIGLNPHGDAKGQTVPIAYSHVPDIEVALKAVVAAGATIVEEPNEVGGGRLISTFKDADGNVTGLIADTAPTA